MTIPITRRTKRHENLAVTARALIALVLSACTYDTHFANCAVRCTADAECPVDLTCGTEGRCRTRGATEPCAAVLETFPSCVGLAKTCGPNADEDCCSTATPIPGGTFFRSYDVASDGMYPSMSYPATVSPFVLDRFEVTVGRFRKFVETGMGTRANPPPAGAGARTLNGNGGQGGWDASWNNVLATDTAALITAVKCDGSKQTWTDATGANEKLPINCVTWYEAFAFCAWDDGFLPTEAEWNFAAAGGGEQRAYPWSSPAESTTIDCSYANYRDCVNPPSGSPSLVGSESPKGDGRWEQADLGGNVWEWTLDGHQTPYANPCNDCADLTSGAMRVTRGGSFLTDVLNLRSSTRFYVPSPNRFDYGIRCARKTL
jgi:formylglycine-generating enzyme required for sulfatase activity